jgi:hypothetical protein
MTESNILPYDGQAILIDDHGAEFEGAFHRDSLAKYAVAFLRCRAPSASWLVVLFRLQTGDLHLLGAGRLARNLAQCPAAFAFKARGNEGSSKDPACSCPEACRTC